MKRRSIPRLWFVILCLVPALLFCGYLLHRHYFRFGQRLVRDPEVLQRGENSAKQHCGHCHALPSPAAHSPRLWNYVLVQMGFRLGIDTFDSHGYFREDQSALAAEYAEFKKNPPPKALSAEEFRLIKNYYLVKSESDFVNRTINPPPLLSEVTIVPLKTNRSGPYATTAATISQNGELWLGEGISRKVYRYGASGSLVADYTIKDMPVAIIPRGNRVTLAFIGSMLPSDERKASIVEYAIQGDKLGLQSVLATDLYRTSSVRYDEATKAFDIAGFGNTKGEFQVLTAGRSSGDIIYTGSGAIWSQRVRLYGKAPQLLVLVAQEKEELLLFEQVNGAWQKTRTLIKFPPEAGVMQFEVADINGDGRQDIVLVNGDDGDLPGELPRAYHGVHVFLQDEQNRFREAFFQNFPGAYRVCISDFNRDNLPDIAAVSYYPRLEKPLFSAMVILQQRGTNWRPLRIHTGANDKFISLACGDVDGDGKTDLLLGAGNLNLSKSDDQKQQTIGFLIKNQF